MTERTTLEEYVLREVRWDDLEAIIETINLAYYRAVGVAMMTVNELRDDLETPGFNLSRDSRILIAPGGEVAGYMEVWDLSEPHVRAIAWGQFHPQHRGNGACMALFEWARQRSAQALELAPAEARVVAVGYALHSDPEVGDMYRRAGFELVRHSLRMVTDLEAEPVAPAWPAGITLRTWEAQEGLEAVVRVVRESFRDHYGYVEIPFEEDVERWRHRKLKNPDFDPSLWFIAMDGDDIAGVSLCDPKVYDDPEMGWVGTLGVRRPWRKRGLGMALLQHSFGEFYRRGVGKVGLGVDASNLTGALRLYERAGMRSDPRRQYDLFEWVVRDGVELSTVAVHA
jgi:GNAT superfamily N-acetyltransferase